MIPTNVPSQSLQCPNCFAINRIPTRSLMKVFIATVIFTTFLTILTFFVAYPINRWAFMAAYSVVFLLIFRALLVSYFKSKQNPFE